MSLAFTIPLTFMPEVLSLLILTFLSALTLPVLSISTPLEPELLIYKPAFSEYTEPFIFTPPSVFEITIFGVYSPPA